MWRASLWYVNSVMPSIYAATPHLVSPAPLTLRSAGSAESRQVAKPRLASDTGQDTRLGTSAPRASLGPPVPCAICRFRNRGPRPGRPALSQSRAYATAASCALPRWLATLVIQSKHFALAASRADANLSLFE